MSFFMTCDGVFINVAQIVAFEVIGPVTMRGEQYNGTFEVRARTTISWPTGGYGAGEGHLYRIAEKFRSPVDAREWIVRNFTTVEDVSTAGHLQR